MLVLDRSCSRLSAHPIDVNVDADALLVGTPPLKTLALRICTLPPISADARDSFLMTWCLWVNTTGGSNYSIPIPGAAGSLGKENPLAGFEDDLSRTIVDCEVNADQWTLMHRYNKATELMGQAVNVSTDDISCPAIMHSIAQLSHKHTQGMSVADLTCCRHMKGST